MADFKNLAWAASSATGASRKFIYLPYRALQGKWGKKLLSYPGFTEKVEKFASLSDVFLSKSLHHIHRPKVSSNQSHSVSNKSLLVQYVLQLSPWSSDTRSLLSSLFFLKRLQAMQEFFHMVTQLAAALQGNMAFMLLNVHGGMGMTLLGTLPSPLYDLIIILHLSLHNLSPPLCMTSYIALVFTWSLPSPLYDLIYCTCLYMISALPAVWPHILHLSLHDLCPPSYDLIYCTCLYMASPLLSVWPHLIYCTCLYMISPLSSVWPHILHLSLHDLSPPLCMASYIALVFTWSLPSPLYDLIYCTCLYMISPLPSVWPHILHLSLHDLSPPLCMTSYIGTCLYMISPLPSVWPHILHLSLHDLSPPLCMTSYIGTCLYMISPLLSPSVSPQEFYYIVTQLAVALQGNTVHFTWSHLSPPPLCHPKSFTT